MVKKDVVTLIKRIRERCTSLVPLKTGVEPRLKNFQDIRCVLFDVYGTLLISGSGDIDSMRDASRDSAFEAALDAAGIEYRKKCGERGIERMVQAIKECHRNMREQGVIKPEVEIREIWRDVFCRMQQAGELNKSTITDDQLEVFAVEYEISVNPIWPMPGAVKVVRELSKSYKTGIVSNAQFYTPLTLAAIADDWGFMQELCVWSYQIRRAKPDNMIFEPIIQSLNNRGISPGQVVYVGNDILNDVATAAQQGCKTVLFAGDKRSLRLRKNNPDIKDLEPHAVITELSQLLQIL